MFARIITVDVKPGQAANYAAAVDRVIPIMRTFAGFRDEIVMLSHDGKHGAAISFWDSAEQAKAYDREGSARVLEMMSPYFDGTPVLTTYDVTNSTVHQISARAVGT